MAAPYDELVANLRALAMASPDNLPVYDTSPSNKTTASSSPTPRSMILTAIATTAIHRSTSNSSEPLTFSDSMPKASSPLCTTLRTNSRLSSRVVSVHSSSLISSQDYSREPSFHFSIGSHEDVRAQELPHNAPSMTELRSEGLNFSMLNEPDLQTVVPLPTKSPGHVPKLIINSPFSLTALLDVISSFGSEKRSLLDSMGLGGILKLQKQRLQWRRLIVFLLSNMDPNTGTINLRSGELTIEDRDVNRVFGLPYKGQEVNLSSRSPEVIPKLKKLLLLDSDSDITIGSVQAILVRDYGRKMNSQERDAFKVAAMIFVDSCFLGPRGRSRTINKDILEHLTEPSRIPNVNWSGYVLKVLKLSAYKVQQSLMACNKTVLVEGCLLFLLVFYLDNLNFGYVTPRHDVLPRIASYTPRLLSELLSYDRVSNPARKTLQYGRSKIRPCEEVVYSRRKGKETAATSPNDMPGEQSTPPILKCSTGHASSNIQTQIDGHVNILEVQASLDEYIHAFTAQIHRSTDELRRRFVLFASSIGQSASPSSCPLKGRHFNTFISSSSGRSKHDDSVLHFDFKNSERHSVPLSCELMHEGAECQSTPQAEVMKECDFIHCYNHFTAQYALASSPFELKLEVKDIPVQIIIEVIRLLSKLSAADRNMSWYIHHVPTKLEVSGESLFSSLYKEEDFTIDTMTGVMRLFHESDDVMYKGLAEKRWRHYLPPQWVEFAMMDQKTSVVTEFNKMFAGEHIDYKVNECPMVIVPVYNSSNWSLYSWNFVSSTVTIIDPVENCMEILVAKHKPTISALHEAMLFCKEVILGCSDMHNIEWNHNYVIDKDGCCSLTRSGLYTAFYARFFDGLTCRRMMLMEDSVTLFQISLLCRLLSSKANKGVYPESIRDAIAGIN